MSEHRYFLHLAFDGSAFHGWQRQPNAATVQQTLEEALSMLLRTSICLTGAGRTDAGVHAEDFYAHFDIDHEMTAVEREKLVFKLNSYLAGDIAIAGIIPVAPGVHASFTATFRTYRYCIARRKNPFRQNYTHFIHGPLDYDLMNQGAALIMSYSDFTSFSKVDSDTRTNICKITQAWWQPVDGELVFTITADRFLRNMVRAIVGTLLQLGTGKITLEALKGIIESHNRSDAGDSVPARGLSLHRVGYPEGTFCE